jgi:hypothetical protein
MGGELVDGVEVVDGAPRRIRLAAFGVGGRFFDLDAGVIGQSSRRFGKREPFHLHEEIEGGALLFAAEAVEKALLRIDAEARRFLAMKGAEAEKAPPLARKLHRFGNDAHDLDALAYSGDRLRRNHAARSPSQRPFLSTELPVTAFFIARPRPASLCSPGGLRQIVRHESVDARGVRAVVIVRPSFTFANEETFRGLP